jgi:hypothetical protein
MSEVPEVSEVHSTKKTAEVIPVRQRLVGRRDERWQFVEEVSEDVRGVPLQ